MDLRCRCWWGALSAALAAVPSIALSETESLDIGDARTAVLEILLSAESEADSDVSILAEVTMEAVPDLPHAGWIDAERRLTTPERYDSSLVPWLLRTVALEELIRYRTQVKIVLAALEAGDRDFRLPLSVADTYPPEKFPEITAYAEELARPSGPDEDRLLTDRTVDWLLSSALGRADPPLAPPAPWFFDVKFKQARLERARSLRERLAAGDDPEEAVRDGLLHVLSANSAAVETLARAHEEQELDVLAGFGGLPALAAESYPGFDEVLPAALAEWFERIARRSSSRELHARWRGIGSMGFLVLSAAAPYTGLPLAASRLAGWAGTSGFLAEAWTDFRGGKQEFDFRRSVFARSDFIMTPEEYEVARKRFGQTLLSSLANAALFVPGLMNWGRIQALLRQGPLALAAHLQTLDAWAAAAGRSRACALRARIARFAIDRIERRLMHLLRRGNPGTARAAQDALRRRKLTYDGFRYDWMTRSAVKRAPAPPKPPHAAPTGVPILTASGRLLRRTAADVRRVLAAAGSGAVTLPDFARSSARSVVLALKDRSRWQLAGTLVGTNLVLKAAVETMIRDGDVWEEDYLFGKYHMPNQEFVINLTIGNVILGTMAFATRLKNPVLRALPSVAVAGAATAGTLYYHTGHVDLKRVGFEMGYNVLCTWFLLPGQISLARHLQSLSREPGTSYLMYRAAWTGTAFVVPTTHSKSVLALFERGDERFDAFKNRYRDAEDDSVYRLPNGSRS